MIQKKGLVPGFLRIQGRIKTKFERGKSIAQCAGAAQTTQKNKTKQSKISTQSVKFLI